MPGGRSLAGGHLMFRTHRNFSVYHHLPFQKMSTFHSICLEIVICQVTDNVNFVITICFQFRGKLV